MTAHHVEWGGHRHRYLKTKALGAKFGCLAQAGIASPAGPEESKDASAMGCSEGWMARRKKAKPRFQLGEFGVRGILGGGGHGALSSEVNPARPARVPRVAGLLS